MGKNIFIPFRALSIDDRERERAARVRHPPIAKSAHRKHRKTRGKTQWPSSSCTHVIRRSRRSFRCLRLDIVVVRRRHRLFFRIRRRGASSSRRPSSPRHRLRARRTHTTGDVQTRLPWWSFPHVRAFSMCPNCVFLSMRARDDRGRVFHTVSSMFVFLVIIIPIPSATSDATRGRPRGRVGHVETSRVGVDRGLMMDRPNQSLSCYDDDDDDDDDDIDDDASPTYPLRRARVDAWRWQRRQRRRRRRRRRRNTGEARRGIFQSATLRRRCVGATARERFENARPSTACAHENAISSSYSTRVVVVVVQ